MAGKTTREDGKPAFYALERGGWRDYVTLLHPPYTLWHVSYVVMGAAVAPIFHADRMAWAVLAFFLAVGIGAHALDELHGRPLGTRIPSGALWAATVIAVTGAISIGVYGTIVASPWLWAFMGVGVFLLVSYNLELFGGRFHSDLWFAAAWGAFPFLVGYWSSALSFSPASVFLAAACLLLSLAQRKLSTQARRLRRTVRKVEGHVELLDGRQESLTVSGLRSVPESALRFMTVSVVFLAAGLVVLRTVR